MTTDPVKRVVINLSIEYQSGNNLGKSFFDVQDLARFLKDNPDVARMVNYIPKDKGKS